MKLVGTVFQTILFCGLVSSQDDGDRLVDSASRQLSEFKKKHPDKQLLTTTAGKPIDIRETDNFNSELVTNVLFIENLKHLTHERIPERPVLSKATGAYGYFEVTHDVTEYTKAKVFEKIGKKTRLFSRLATGQIDKGGSESNILSVRSMSFKLYTEEGNLDLLNINTPVYFYRDPLFFPDAVRALRPNPKTNLRDSMSALDQLTLRPEILHATLWSASEYGLPRGFRHMRVFPVHTFEIYNKRGESFFVRFKFLPELGFKSLSLDEATILSAVDPDFFTRDLYNSIEMGNYPAWKMEMDILTEKDVGKLDFDPFDVTTIWSNGTYRPVSIGRVVLNQNVDNHFVAVEQSAFTPANLVPGIRGPPDLLFKGRVLAYADAHVHRLGINHNNIEVNCPMYKNTYNRDGLPPVSDNMGEAPNYYPNSFNGPEPYLDKASPTHCVTQMKSNSVPYEQSRRFYNHVLVHDAQKQRLVNNLVILSLRAEKWMTERVTELFLKVDKDLATRYNTSLAMAKKSINVPSTFDDTKAFAELQEKCKLGK